MKNVREIRHMAKMTQREFSEAYHIPLDTIKKWESGLRTPPVYVIELLEYRANKEKEENREKIKCKNTTSPGKY
jgi:DNA-binding transcriptional regulator YiaG